MKDVEALIPKYGGCRKDKSFPPAQLIFDILERFCDRDLEKRRRTHDQMMPALRKALITPCRPPGPQGPFRPLMIEE